MTCLVDGYYPEVGEAAVGLLRRLRVDVDFPEAPRCCGLPAYEAGFHHDATHIARQFMDAFGEAAYVVVLSGACAAMMKRQYPELLTSDPEESKRAEQFAGRVHELSSFIVNVCGRTELSASLAGRVAYQESCRLRRDLHVRDEPRRLIAEVEGVEVTDVADQNCCGYGGHFAGYNSALAQAILESFLDKLEATKAETVVGTDMGCLMHVAAGLVRRGSAIRPLHLAQLLHRQVN